MVALVGGCVNLSGPPQLRRTDAATFEEPPADGAASGGNSGSGGAGGAGPSTGGAGGADGAAAGGSGGARIDAAGVDAADAAPVPDAAGGDLGAAVADAASSVDVAADASADLAQPDAPPPPVDAPPPPVDAMPDLAADVGPPLPVIAFTDSSSIIHAPGTGGTAFDAPCGGASQALIGLFGTSGGVVGLNSVQGNCGVIEVAGTVSYQLTTRASATLGPFGPVRPTSHDGSCPANEVIVGFEGGSGSWINYLHVYCAGLSITGSAGNYTVTVGAPFKVATRLGPVGGTPFPARYCPAGQIATGILGAAGSAIDRFGLHCAKPVAR